MHRVNVSVVFALPENQYLYETTVARGASVEELIKLSGFLKTVPELANRELSEMQIGVYAKKVELDYLLEEGDRVEIYRPLQADPKEVRRQLALIGKTMGKK